LAHEAAQDDGAKLLSGRRFDADRCDALARGGNQLIDSRGEPGYLVVDDEGTLSGSLVRAIDRQVEVRKGLVEAVSVGGVDDLVNLLCRWDVRITCRRLMVESRGVADSAELTTLAAPSIGFAMPALMSDTRSHRPHDLV
jgi:hypothetical protein